MKNKNLKPIVWAKNANEYKAIESRTGIQGEKETILIVDDEPQILQILQFLLDFDGYEVIAAKDGQEALELLSKHDVAIIICDQNMPDMTGADVLRKVSETKPDVGRIILTGEGSFALAIQSINYSHVDYFLQKTSDPEQLREAVNDAAKKYRLVRENQRLEQINKNQSDELAKTYKQLQRELEFAGKIHQRLLRGKVPANIPDFKISVESKASKHLDGDFYDFYRLGGEKIDLLLGDVMGKGIPAALVGIAVRNQISQHMQQFTNYYSGKDLLSQRKSVPLISEILADVHKTIYSDLSDLDFFVTLFYARFDLKKHTFTYIDCGAAKPIWYREIGNKTLFLSGENFPLGIVETDIFQELEMAYSPRDTFVFYSDGVTEAMSPEGELFGTVRLKDLIAKNFNMSTGELVRTIITTIKEFSNREQFDDDVTIIVIRDNRVRYYL